jgi:hypothetical protein
MLSPRLQQTWDEATPALREAALVAAQHTLENLVHYPHLAQNKAWYKSDVQEIAAEFLAWRAEGVDEVEVRLNVKP